MAEVQLGITYCLLPTGEACNKYIKRNIMNKVAKIIDTKSKAQLTDLQEIKNIMLEMNKLIFKISSDILILTAKMTK